MSRAANHSKKLARERVEDHVAEQQLRQHSASRKGELIQVCEKCARRLEKNGDPEGLGDVPNILRTIAREDGLEIRVVPAGCLKLCPPDGISVTSETMLAARPPQATIVRTREDVAALYQELQVEDRRRRHRRG